MMPGRSSNSHGANNKDSLQQGPTDFSVLCGRNFYFSYLSIHISYKSLENEKIYQLEIFKYAQKIIIYVCSGSSNSTTKTQYLIMDSDT